MSVESCLSLQASGLHILVQIPYVVELGRYRYSVFLRYFLKPVSVLVSVFENTAVSVSVSVLPTQALYM